MPETELTATTEPVSDTGKPAQTETSPWYPAEYKDLVSSRGWDSPDKFLKSYKEMEKAFSGRPKIPDEKSDAKEKRAFYDKIGVPRDATGYELTLDESMTAIRNEPVENAMKMIALESGVPQGAFQNLVKGYYEAVAEGMQRQYEEGAAQLRKDLGDRYDEEVRIAQQFAQNCSEEFRKILEDTGLGNNPVFIKEFISLGKKTRSDSLIRGETINPQDKDYKPKYENSPEMYRNGDDEESKKARQWYINRGYKY